MDWYKAAEAMERHIVRITTPQGSGTGFLVRRTEDNVFGFATAAHVVRDAITWKQIITISHPATAVSHVLHAAHRTGIIHHSLDSAYIGTTLPDTIGNALPEEPIEAVPSGRTVKIGVEVGWMGFPYLVDTNKPCFFSGHVSAFVKARYFIDGVAIPGVSGGPAFCYQGNAPKLMVLGSITQYNPAHSQHGVIPGLLVADDCKHWHEAVKALEQKQGGISLP